MGERETQLVSTVLSPEDAAESGELSKLILSAGSGDGQKERNGVNEGCMQ